MTEWADIGDDCTASIAFEDDHTVNVCVRGPDGHDSWTLGISDRPTYRRCGFLKLRRVRVQRQSLDLLVAAELDRLKMRHLKRTAAVVERKYRAEQLLAGIAGRP